MGYAITFTEDGRFDWVFFMSSYGLASGTEDTLDSALVELAIGEAAVMEAPLSRAMCEVMRSDPSRFAADFERPGTPGWRPMNPYNGPDAQ